MAIDVLCLTEEQQKNLNELLEACRFLVEIKRLKMAETAVDYGIERITNAIRKIDKAV